MTWDVLIVGVGPAGSSLATLLADEGLSVLLLERAVFPRDKVCGEFPGPGCRRILEALGEIESAARPVRGMRVDRLLLANALRRPVECRQGVRVENLIVGEGEVRGVLGRSRDGEPREFRARITVGADGCNSVVAHRLGFFRWNRSHRRTALCVHYKGVEQTTDCAEVYLGREGYGILNALPGGEANLSLLVARENFARFRDHMAELAAEVISDALSRGDTSARFLARYDAARRGELASRYRLEALVRTVILRPALAAFAIRRLAAAARAAESLLGALGGLLPPRELLTPQVLGSLLWQRGLEQRT